MKTKIVILIFYIVQSVLVTDAYAQNKSNLTVNISGIEQIKGNIFVFLYSKDEGFPTNFSKAVNYKKIKVNAKSTTVQFNNINSGNYAVSVYHDINSNNTMETNFLGIPQEPVGVSNNAKGNFGPPDFEDAKFYFYNSKTIEIKIK